LNYKELKGVGVHFVKLCRIYVRNLKPMKTPTIVILLCAAGLFHFEIKAAADAVQPVVDAETEALIDKLPEIAEIGYGYSATFGGSQFLPDKDSARIGVVLFGGPAPENSDVLEAIVRRGAKAVPALLKHLDDARETKIPPMSGILWTQFEDEYDYNRRTQKAPKGVNKKRVGFDENQPPSHIITVGDLCFVALGQIVNRSFIATRYQPSLGLGGNSPTYSKTLCAAAREDFQNFDEEKHRELLLWDFSQPDKFSRRIEAIRREEIDSANKNH